MTAYIFHRWLLLLLRQYGSVPETLQETCDRVILATWQKRNALQVLDARYGKCGKNDCWTANKPNQRMGLCVDCRMIQDTWNVTHEGPTA